VPARREGSTGDTRDDTEVGRGAMSDADDSAIDLNTTDPSAIDPVELLKSRSYIGLLLFGALIGIPIAIISFSFLVFVSKSENYVFQTLPIQLGFSSEPWWWPAIPLTLSGLLVAAAITYLPGTGGHRPAEGFHASGAVQPIELPGILLAALASLCLGAVLGPEAPLIAIGSGLGVWAVHLLMKGAPAGASVLVGAAGSFAAVSALLGSPLVGAFLMLELTGIGGALLGVVLVPGLLASGIGALVFVGLNQWGGFGEFSLAIPNIPSFESPTVSEFAWAIAIGLVASLVGTGIKKAAIGLQPIVARRALIFTPLLGLAIAAMAIAFGQLSGKSSSFVLFSGESSLATLVEQTGQWSVGALVLLSLFKGMAYAASMSGFRGGPVFPGMFIGAAGGMALSHFAGLPMIAGVAMGMGAMLVAMLGMPLTSVLLTSVFLQSDAVALMPLIIVAVVVAYVASARLTPDGPAEPMSAVGPNQTDGPNRAALP